MMNRMMLGSVCLVEGFVSIERILFLLRDVHFGKILI